MKQAFDNDWQEQLGPELDKPYFHKLREFLKEEYKHHRIYPPKDEVMSAFHTTSYSDTKVVILGQDPYHGFGQAHGLSFSVRPGVTLPPSLRNIYKELHNDLGLPIPEHGYLQSWAKQGVLLLNTVLTVREGTPQSHQGQGWEEFTNQAIDQLNKRDRPVIFLLWGKHAQGKKERIDTEKHRILESPHPSPFSATRGFFGSRPFSKINDILVEWQEEPIDWELPVQAPKQEEAE
ncbi:uracil-DNA glycosylase [Paenalkalicoccus suaedae]|uniref:Uracil-DNA glycosylase n=1 Tax=Paenalkalicoccus suaedae TaxID=2592382 RepID=A0A859FKP1_9BACI|nr:uracil-DNA glycosylase [Paenalkalicoccus suaedae]QKS73349.1 uracil-DNA glycosylase [Paenalkalicoccus suaedae]